MEKQQPPPYSAEGYPPAPGPGIYPNLQNPQGPPPTGKKPNLKQKVSYLN